MLSSSESDPHPLLPLLRTASPSRIFIALGVLVTFVLGLYATRDVSTPVLAALGIAYVLAPLVNVLEKRVRLPRTLAVSLLMLGAFVLALTLIATLLPMLLTQFSSLTSRMPQAIAMAMAWCAKTFHITIPTDANEILASARSAMEDLGPGMLGRLGKGLATVAARSVGALGAAVSLVLIPLFTFYFLIDWTSITSNAIRLLPSPMQGPILAKLRQIDRSLSAYVHGVLTVSTILAVLYSVALTILDVPLGLLIGVIAGFGYVIPFASGALGIGLGVTFSLLELRGFGQVTAILLVFGIGNVIESFLLTPRIVGDSLGLPPMAVILAVMTFGSLFGFIGVLLALPMAAVVNVVGADLLALWRSSSMYRTGLRASESQPMIPTSLPSEPPFSGDRSTP